jgi:hypothetical protein
MSNPVGALSNRTSMDLIMFSVFTFENLEEGTNTPFSLLTQKNLTMPVRWTLTRFSVGNIEYRLVLKFKAVVW